MPLPTTLGHLLGDESILGYPKNDEEEKKDAINKDLAVAKRVTFMEHIENL